MGEQQGGDADKPGGATSLWRWVERHFRRIFQDASRQGPPGDEQEGGGAPAPDQQPPPAS